MSRQRSCGRCQYFTKMLALTGNSGLCQFFDCRANADYGHHCKSFKPIKYNRRTLKLLTETLISEER